MRDRSLLLVLALAGCQAIGGISEKEPDGTSPASTGGSGGQATGGNTSKGGASGAGAAGGVGQAAAAGASGNGASAGLAGQAGEGGAGAAGIGGAGAGGLGGAGAGGKAGAPVGGAGAGGAGKAGAGGGSCTAGEARCNGATLEVCTAGQIVATPCDGASPFCDAAQARCEPCLPGHVTKSGSTISVCSDDGGGYVAATCASDFDADAWAGRCTQPSSVARITTGDRHVCALLPSGAPGAPTYLARCWGENGAGQLKDGTTVDRYAAVPAGVGAVRDIAAGFDHTCAVLADGTVNCWGANNNSQLGPTTLPFINNVVQIVAGFHFNCARKDDATVWCWGRNADGSLGDGTTVTKLTPKQVPGLTDIVGLHADATNTTVCARHASGAVDCWGNDVLSPAQVAASAEEVAVARPTGSSVPTTSEIVVLRNAAGGIDYVKRAGAGFGPPTALAAGPFTAIDGGAGICGVREDGSVQCGSISGTTPAVPTAFSAFGAGTSAEVALGANFRCVRTLSGNVACEGTNDRGQIGNGKPPMRAVPKLVRGVGLADYVAQGLGSTWAVMPGGITRGWGTSSALAITDEPFATTAPLLGDDVEKLWVGAGVAYVRKRTGALNFFNAGTLSTVGRLMGLAQPQVEAWPRIDRDLGLSATGEITFFAVNTNGNNEGIFGTGTTGTMAAVASTVPLQNVVGIAYELDGNETNQHMCAWLTDKSMRCWGRAVEGQVGTGVSGVGAKVTNPTEPAWGASSPPILQVVVGGTHTCARDASGEVYCWGANVDKQLGFAGGTTSAPVKVPGVSGAIGLAAGRSHTCAWYADGTAKCWGKNTTWQCGDSSTTSPIAPTTVAGLADVRHMVARDEHTCAIHHDGRLSCWGSTASGRLGDGTLSVYTTPQVVEGL